MKSFRFLNNISWTVFGYIRKPAKILGYSWPAQAVCSESKQLRMRKKGISSGTLISLPPLVLPYKVSRAVRGCPSVISRGVTRGKGGNNSPGAESLRGRRMATWGAEESQQCHKYFLQYSTSASERTQVRTWGRQTSFLLRAPSNLVTPLVISSLLLLCVCSHAAVWSFEVK